MSVKAKVGLGLKQEETLTTLADKGYYKGSELKKCHDDNIDTLVAIRKSPNKNKAAEVRKDKFFYNKTKDDYLCPQGKVLKREGMYSRRLRGKVQNKFTRYIADHTDCVNCPLYNLCVNSTRQSRQKGKQIDRSEYEDARQVNDAQVMQRKNEYRRRQAIVEHPFGTIKRQFDYTYTLMKGLQNVETEFSIIHLCYNLKRVTQIMCVKELIKALYDIFWVISLGQTSWNISTRHLTTRCTTRYGLGHIYL